jgi:hypothetical protein
MTAPGALDLGGHRDYLSWYETAGPLTLVEE